MRATRAIWSPDSGIVEAEALVRALAEDCDARGVMRLSATPFVSGGPGGPGLVVDTGREQIGARVVVNAAGLYADEVSATLDGEPFTIHPARGEYCEIVPSRRDLAAMARVSAAPPEGTQPRRAPDEDDGRSGAGGADSAVPVEERTTTRTAARAWRRSSSRRANCCRRSGPTICGSAAAASARSSTGPRARSRTS